MIENISIEKLHPHPDNPRRDVGDVTELAASIKASGVLQNLTVVPATGYFYGDYTVIIGHRRLAAAKLAGLTELPCAVVEMDQKTQVATMLLENMQRSDLTVYEQAQGFQMMLDMGETVESVADMTGLSQSTIRRRTRLLQFDADTFKATEGRNIDLQDYEKLFEIKDAARRDKVLEQIGTNNFNNVFQSAKDEERREEQRAGFIAALEAYAKPLEANADKSNYKYVQWTSYTNNIENICSGDYEYFYELSSNGSYAYIYRAYTDEERREINDAEAKRAAEAAATAEREQRIDEINERMFTLRKNFIREGSLKGKAVLVKEYAARTLAENGYINEALLADVLNLQEDAKEYNEIWEIISPRFAVDPERVLLALAYSFSGDSESLNFFSNSDQTLARLDDIYTMLGRFGYEMSDEEKALRDGTHELFAETAK